MDIIISNSSSEPIYEQIVSQIKGQIVCGKLVAGDALPSMRVLAGQLRISIITTKRAYEELEKMGLIESVVGKGCFVKAQNKSAIKEQLLVETEKYIRLAVGQAKQAGLSATELCEMVNLMFDM